LGAKRRSAGGKATRAPTDATTERADTPETADPDAVTAEAREKRVRRGRPHDYDLDDAEKEIEAANQPEESEARERS
jgi:hypothetical protein